MRVAFQFAIFFVVLSQLVVSANLSLI